MNKSIKLGTAEFLIGRQYLYMTIFFFVALCKREIEKCMFYITRLFHNTYSEG